MTPEEKEKLKGDIKRLEWYKQLRTKMNGDVQWVFGELVNTDNLGKYFDTKVIADCTELKGKITKKLTKIIQNLDIFGYCLNNGDSVSVLQLYKIVTSSIQAALPLVAEQVAAQKIFQNIASSRIEWFDFCTGKHKVVTLQKAAPKPIKSPPPAIHVPPPPTGDHPYCTKTENNSEEFRKMLIEPDPNYQKDTRKCSLCPVVGDDHHEDAGRLLYANQDAWVHLNCAEWSAEVVKKGNHLFNVGKAISRGRFLKCAWCHKSGATIGCHSSNCNTSYHFTCARYSGCWFSADKTVFCSKHCGYSDSNSELPVNITNFVVEEPVLIDLETSKTNSKHWKHNIAIYKISVHHGMSTTMMFGQADPELSVYEDHIVTNGYVATRRFWSSVEPGKKSNYLFQCNKRTKEKSLEVQRIEASEHKTIVHGEFYIGPKSSSPSIPVTHSTATSFKHHENVNSICSTTVVPKSTKESNEDLLESNKEQQDSLKTMRDAMENFKSQLEVLEESTDLTKAEINRRHITLSSWIQEKQNEIEQQIQSELESNCQLTSVLPGEDIATAPWSAAPQLQQSLPEKVTCEESLFSNLRRNCGKTKECDIEEEVHNLQFFDVDHTIFYPNYSRPALGKIEKKGDCTSELYFKVDCEEFSMKHNNANVILETICRKVQELRHEIPYRQKCPYLPLGIFDYVSFFGLANPVTSFILKQNPGLVKNNNHQELLAESSESCSRTSLVFRKKNNKMRDKFEFLRSSYITPVLYDTGQSLRDFSANKKTRTKSKILKYTYVSGSQIHGNGLYTDRPIKSGDNILEYIGEVIYT